MKLFSIAVVMAVMCAAPVLAGEICRHPAQGVQQDGVLRLQCGRELVPAGPGYTLAQLMRGPSWYCDRHVQNEATHWLTNCHLIGSTVAKR